MNNTTHIQAVQRLAIVACLALVTVACAGSTDVADGAASGPDALIEYRECLAQNGVELDFEVGADGGSVSLNTGGQEDDPQSGGLNPEAFEAAHEECGHLLDAVTAEMERDPEADAALRDASLAFRACMDERGFSGAGGMTSTASGDALSVEPGLTDGTDPQAIDFSDPDFDHDGYRTASEECAVVYDQAALGGQS